MKAAASVANLWPVARATALQPIPDDDSIATFYEAACANFSAPPATITTKFPIGRNLEHLRTI